MIYGVYAIRDMKAEAFAQPFFMATRGLAIRAFSDEANNPSSMVCKHSSDFSLFHFGTFDDSTGTFDLTNPVSLGIADEFKRGQDA